MKKLQQMKYVIALMLSAACFVSCERDVDENKITLTDIYADFEIKENLDVTRTSIDFEQGENTNFTAEFSKPVIWELSITGKKSGAQKIITGFSKELNAETAVWDGSTTTFPMFKSGEDCSVELNVPSEDTTLVLTESNGDLKDITVKKAKVDNGVIITDFESGNNYRDGWDWFFQSGVSFFNLKSSKKAAQGSYYYKMFGECNWDWLIGMINIPATAFENNSFGLSDDPNNLYFNVLLNVQEPNARLLIRFKEDDNNDGVFDIETEDEYSITITDTEEGWQQISVKYSDLVVVDENGNAIIPNGNRVHNPDLLNIIDVLLLADPETGYSRVDMDYMIFTENEPLKP